MAYNNNYSGGKPQIANGAEGQTLWLKQKMRKKRDGTETEVWQGSVDLGGGKMLKISLPGDLYTIPSDKGDLLPAYVSKWKSDNRSNNGGGGRKKAW